MLRGRKGIASHLAGLIWGPNKKIDAFAYAGDTPDCSATGNDLEKFFWANDGPLIHKWLHYFDIYDRHFAAYRHQPVRMLEIGVSKGGSLSMWREYFGPEAIIYGVDIDPACMAFDGKAAQVRIGSQSDPAFMQGVVSEMGGVDIVLDDGSHYSADIRASLGVLFPLLSDGGLYAIEDLHATYWPNHFGGYRRPGSFMTDLKTMMDDMHHWYHNRGQRIAATADHLAGLHIYDSIAVLEKRNTAPPRHAQRGQVG